jgi:hypothetical protein
LQIGLVTPPGILGQFVARAREVVNRRAREARDRAMEAARQGRDEFNRQRQNLGTAFDRAREQAQRGTPDAGQEG